MSIKVVATLPDNLLASHLFKAELDGYDSAYVSEVVKPAIMVKQEVFSDIFESLAHGGKFKIVHQHAFYTRLLPLVNPQDPTLLWLEEHKKVAQGVKTLNEIKRTLDVSNFDRQGNVVSGWTLVGASLVSVRQSELSGRDSGGVTETLALTYDRIENWIIGVDNTRQVV